MKILIQLIAVTVLTFQVAAAALPASSPAQPSVSAGGNSFNPQFSADGQHLVFVSHANNLVTNDDLGLWLDVFVHDLVSSNTVLVSVSTTGFGGANGDANYPSISSNGQFIAFASRASNLVAGDTNGAIDVFVRDVNAGITRLVSADVNGNPPFDPAPSLNVPLSGNPLISADGRWVFFESRATNLIATGAPLGSVNIYARDMWSNLTVRVTSDTNGNSISDNAALAQITPDGRFAIFTTTNKTLVSGTTNFATEVFVRDVQAGQTIWVSTNVAGLLTNTMFPSDPTYYYRCSNPVLSDDGRFAAFTAMPTFSGAGNSLHVLRHDLQTGTTLVISRAVTNESHGIQISSDGRYVLFEEMDGAYARVRVWGPEANDSAFISCGGDDARGNPAMNPSARAIAFVGCSSVYFIGYHTFGIAVRVSANTNGGPSIGDYQFVAPVVSPDGTRVAFETTANDLVSGDLNGMSDIFLRDVNAGTTELITKAHPSKPASTSFAHSFLGPNSVSADGRFIVSTRYDDPSAPRDTNGLVDVFVSDALSGAAVAISINLSNSVQNTNSYGSPVISADGSTVAAVQHYVSVARASNGVFSSSGMSVATRGTFPSFSDSPVLSGDGLLLAFRSDGNDLNPNVNDANNAPDVWLQYFFPGGNGLFFPTNYLVSSPNSYNSGNGPSLAPNMTTDGAIITFGTKAGNLLSMAAGGTSGGQYANYQIVAALPGTNRTATNYLVNVPKRLCSYTISYQQYDWFDANNTNIHHTNLNAVLTPIPLDISNAVFSANNRFVVYAHADGSSIWRHDLSATQSNYTFVSHAPSPNDLGSIVATNVVPSAPNTLVCSNCRNPSVSADGNVVTYERTRSGSSIVDVFAADLTTGTETLVSGNLSGVSANGSSILPLVSANGRYVVFQSRANDLVANDTNGVNDIFIRDRLLGLTMLASANAQGQPGNGPSVRPVMAADGRTVVFQSFANDLVTGDYNDKRDLFVLKLGAVDSDGDGMDDDWEVAYFGNLSRDGTGDFDGDGVSDIQEFRAGTDPTNSNSVFRVFTVAPIGGGSAHVMWTGNPARNYRVEFKDDLNAAAWTALNATISWNGSTASITDSTASNSTHRYYHVVRLP